MPSKDDISSIDETSEVIVTRKGKRKGVAKVMKKFYGHISTMAIPFIRYSIIPGLLLFSVYYTEPKPTLLELLNPFY